MSDGSIPGAALRKLIEDWRDSAEWEMRDGSPEFGKGRDQCADELEALVRSSLSQPQQEQEKEEDLTRVQREWMTPTDSPTAANEREK